MKTLKFKEQIAFILKQADNARYVERCALLQVEAKPAKLPPVSLDRRIVSVLETANTFKGGLLTEPRHAFS